MGKIHLKDGANGQEYTVDEDSSVADLRQTLNLSPEFSLVNSQGSRIPEDQKIGNFVKNGETVMPVVEPKYGASSPSNSFDEWDMQRIRYGFNKIKSVFPDAVISSDSKLILIPSIQLDTKKFNKQSTRFVIAFNDSLMLWGKPGLYVDRDLRVHGRKSQHLDESLTPEEMLSSGYVILCWYNQIRTSNLAFLLSNAIIYLDGLKK